MPPGTRARLLPCFHRFHAPCIDRWLIVSKLRCPVCKVQVAAL